MRHDPCVRCERAAQLLGTPHNMATGAVVEPAKKSKIKKSLKRKGKRS